MPVAKWQRTVTTLNRRSLRHNASLLCCLFEFHLHKRLLLVRRLIVFKGRNFHDRFLGVSTMHRLAVVPQSLLRGAFGIVSLGVGQCEQTMINVNNTPDILGRASSTR